MGKKNLGYEHIQELSTYFNDIQNIRRLTRREEQILSEKIQKGDEQALNKLVYHNLKFVVNIAKNYRNNNVPFADIISEGNLGLIRAAHKFDSTKGVKFISYAVWWIKNSINECIEKYNRYNETLSYDDYTINKCTDLDNKFEQINEDFEEKINNIQSRKDAIESLMKCLHEREIKILTLFFGLNGGREMTLEEVGKEMCLTNERVRQIKDSALSKLKCEVLTYTDDEIDTFRLLR